MLLACPVVVHQTTTLVESELARKHGTAAALACIVEAQLTSAMCRQRSALEYGDRLDVRRVRKHVHHPRRHQLEAVLVDENAGIAR